MTLLELTMTLALLLGVVGAFLVTFDGVNQHFAVQVDRSNNNDQAQLAIEEIDREVRSGNLLYDPALETDPGMMLRVYTQTNAPTRNPSNRCVQWKINGTDLQVRSWSVNWDTDGIVTSWRTVAEDVVNKTDNPQVRAFSLDPESTKGGRTLNVTIVVNTNHLSGSDVYVQTSVTGRNTEYGYPQDICNSIPP
jgi:hypothetical protein